MHAAVLPLTLGALDGRDFEPGAEHLTEGSHRRLVQRSVKAPKHRHDIAVPVVDAVQVINAPLEIRHARNGNHFPALSFQLGGLGLVRDVQASERQ